MNKKIIFGIVTVAVIGGIGYFVWKKKKGTNSGTASSGSKLSSCIAMKDAAGKGKGKWLAVKNSKDRNLTGDVNVGSTVSIDGAETTVTKIWKDKSKRQSAFQFANGVTSGKKMCF